MVHAEQANGPVAGVIVQLGGQTPLGLARALAAAGVPVVGTSPEAIHLAEGSDILREALGDHVHEYLIRNKREEWDEYKAHVTPYELERYLPVL